MHVAHKILQKYKFKKRHIHFAFNHIFQYNYVYIKLWSCGQLSWNHQENRQRRSFTTNSNDSSLMLISEEGNNQRNAGGRRTTTVTLEVHLVAPARPGALCLLEFSRQLLCLIYRYILRSIFDEVE